MNNGRDIEIMLRPTQSEKHRHPNKKRDGCVCAEVGGPLRGKQERLISRAEWCIRTVGVCERGIADSPVHRCGYWLGSWAAHIRPLSCESFYSVR